MDTNKDLYIALDINMSIVSIEQEHRVLDVGSQEFTEAIDIMDEVLPKIKTGEIYHGKVEQSKLRGKFNPLLGQVVKDDGTKTTGWSGVKLEATGTFVTFCDVSARQNEKLVRLVLRNELPSRQSANSEPTSTSKVM